MKLPVIATLPNSICLPFPFDWVGMLLRCCTASGKVGITLPLLPRPSAFPSLLFSHVHCKLLGSWAAFQLCVCIVSGLVVLVAMRSYSRLNSNDYKNTRSCWVVIGCSHLKGESASCYRDRATWKSCVPAGDNVWLKTRKAEQMPKEFVLWIKAEAHHASVLQLRHNWEVWVERFNELSLCSWTNKGWWVSKALCCFKGEEKSMLRVMESQLPG